MATAEKDTPSPPTPPATAEWRVAIPAGSSVVLIDHEWAPVRRAWLATTIRIAATTKMVWRMGADDPRKVIHGLKVGIALAVVSLFYYLRPLYNGAGGAAMWAVMTVVVIFEFTVGASLCKGLNRAAATVAGGALALAIHWVASKADRTGQLIILDSAVFIFASTATFTRFVPAFKSRFEYGATIFILTFSLVAVSGYRVDQLVGLAQQRLSTIAVGVSICLMICMFVCPVWAGTDLHLLITSNMDKLADSLEGCIEEYFNGNEAQKARAYKCVLNSKASEDSLANLAIWEPKHGPFGFRHPWSHYQKIGASLRHCAYSIEALHGFSHSGIHEAPELVKNHLRNSCMKLSSKSSKVLKELSATIKSMQQSENLNYLIEGMKEGVQEVKSALKSLPSFRPSSHDDQEDGHMKRLRPLEAMLLVTVASLLMEIPARVEEVVEATDKLSSLAGFKPAGTDLTKV